MIKSTSHAALVECKRRRKEYDLKVVIRCFHDPEQIIHDDSRLRLVRAELARVPVRPGVGN
ncbi:hypothetical protein GN244_ATG19752 [Phytophthora infestans]|uniref:Uncharacterized protein n=1 Tax=Phytophthora infestans TaxID=4787 RepID=A0A833SL25_PHYIN|nr:hypothetical protein GN244_ATG19752 [Phytophthora infestans]